MIQVSEDPEPVQSRGIEPSSQGSKPKASIHPYARLFSQIRNS